MVAVDWQMRKFCRREVAPRNASIGGDATCFLRIAQLKLLTSGSG